MLGIPLVVACFTLAAGFLPIGMIEAGLRRTGDLANMRPLINDLKIAVLLIAFVASATALAISRYIVGPLEQMIGRSGS
jgi:hypothetical protein